MILQAACVNVNDGVLRLCLFLSRADIHSSVQQLPLKGAIFTGPVWRALDLLTFTMCFWPSNNC